jgi:hypothetical protein
MNKYHYWFLMILLGPSLLWASSFTDVYKVGSGSTYFMKSKSGADAHVSIYTASKTDKSLNVEYFVESVNTFIPSRLWQQFKLVREGSGPLKMTEGYIQKDSAAHPEKMEAKHLEGKEGVKTTDFLFSTFEQINQYLINKEKVKVPAGSLEANRYKLTSNGQTIEFWIAENQSPMVLVKLISTGSKAPHNYELQLTTLVKNVAPKIEPSKAKKLSKEMRKIVEASLK